jgi:anti-sigma B factor antagonist
MERVHIDSKFADRQGELMVVEVGGYIDQSNSFQLQKLFDDLIQSDCFKVIVDFGELNYMSSAGWGVFVGEIKRFRDNGGDIKLANMSADINDVFQMLEFYHILEDYPTVTEAAKSFLQDDSKLDLMLNADLEGTENSRSEMDKNQIQNIKNNSDIINSKQEIIEFIPNKSKWQNIDTSEKDVVEQKLEKTVDLKHLPLQQKIRFIVAENPMLGFRGIKKILLSDHFGNTKVSIIKLYRVLKELDLDSKEKRYRFYRSC